MAFTVVVAVVKPSFSFFFGFAMTFAFAGEKVWVFDVAALVDLGYIRVMIMWCHCNIL